MSACAERALWQLHHCEKRHKAVAVGFNTDRFKCSSVKRINYKL